MGDGFASSMADIFDDLFGDMMGGGRRGRANGRERGSDLRYNLELSLEDAFHGKQATVRVASMHACETCHGSGAEAGVRTTAKPEIWSDRAGFEAKAADYAAAADRLAELAAGDDAAAFAAQLAVVRASCQSCHDGYKS